MNEAEFEFCTPKAPIIYSSLLPEVEKTKRSEVRLEKNDKDEKIKLYVRASDITILRASLNTWLRLIKIADEISHNI